MIEVIYKDEKQTAKGNEESFNLPKNIRQIGIPNEKYRIYIEDYVYTFLKKIAEKAEEEEKGAAAVFTGEIKWNSGTGYLFIRGALTAEAGEISAEHVEFSDLTWQKLHEEIEHYFAGQEIIGWFLTQKSLQMEVTEGVQRIHMKLFGGEKALMLMDPVEKEEAFFCYDNGRLLRQSGYYIYYEKNPQMQAYMLEKNPEKVIQGMITGRIKKELKEICLLDQVYVKAEDGKQTVAKYVEEVAKANGAKIAIKGFVRFETGEGIEKRQDDFAAEVAAQVAGK